jgi:hypothetical protein
MLNPREKPFQIEAYLQGVGITEESHYGIIWEAMLLNGDDIGEAISIFPGEKAVKDNIKILRGTGPVIQIEVLNPPLPDGKKYETKEIVIMASQPEITMRTKAVYIKISEVSGIFTISKLDISMEPQNMADLSCNILGGKSSDYKEVVWFAETDSIGREIVKIMPDKGQDVKVMGVHDGTVYVTAMYRNEIAECRVQVKSSFYLKLQYEIFFTYPGAKKEGNLPVEVEFEVRPFTAQVMWVPQGPTPDANDPIAEVLASTQNYETGKGKVTINPIKEGSFELVGLTNRSTARMTVIIKNVYRLQVSNSRVFMQPGNATTYSPPIKPSDPYWNYNSQYLPVMQKIDGADKIGDSIYMPFVVCPPDHRISFSPASLAKMAKYGISHEISPILKVSELEGRGIIKLTVSREIPGTEYGEDQGMILSLDMKKPLEDAVIDPSLYSSNPLYPNNQILLRCQLPLHQTLAIPVFQRVDGFYSNYDNKAYKYKYYMGNSASKYPANTTLTNINPSASTAFDVNASNWKLRPTGVLPEFNTATYAQSKSEYMTISGSYNRSATGHNVTYNLDISDGESHYILLDKTHEGMYYEFDETAWIASKTNFENQIKAQTFYKDKFDNRAPKVDLVDLNGSKAIRITGGNDYIVYDRVLIKDRKKWTFEYFSPTSSGEAKIYDVSQNTGIINNAANPMQFDEYIDGVYVKDYYLVKRYGISLSLYQYSASQHPVKYNVSEDEYGDEVYTLDDRSVLDTSVVNQIVYWKQGQRPIRVRYIYSRNEENNNIVSVISNDGDPVDFNNAKEYFGSGRTLYVTKPDGRGDYFIKNRFDEEGHSYFLNGTASQINSPFYSGCGSRSHQIMVQYNPHFEELFNGTLYIVSDFDIGSNKDMWYTGGSDYAVVYPSGGYVDNNGNYTRRYQGNMDILRYLTKSGSKGRWSFYFYDTDNGQVVGGNARYIFFDDENDANDLGQFYNFNNGYAWTVGTRHHLVIKLFASDVLDGMTIGDAYSDALSNPNRLYIPTRIGFSGTVSNAKQINWKAILSALKHNNDDGSYTAIINKFDGVKTAAELEKRYYGSLTVDADYRLNGPERTSIYNLIKQGNEKGLFFVSIGDNPTFSTTGYPNFKTNTVYFKRDIEKGYNRIHPLFSFANEHGVGGFKFDTFLGYTTYTITEDITNMDLYEPVSSDRNEVVFTSQPVTLSLKYKNSYSTNNTNSNEINIRITHKVRSGVFSDSGNGSNYVKNDWNNMEKTKNMPAPFKDDNSRFFNKYYEYFFIPKDGEY